MGLETVIAVGCVGFILGATFASLLITWTKTPK